MQDDLRSKLDAASLLPRGRWKELWQAAADEFTAPASALVGRVFEDQRVTGVEAATAWLAKPEMPIPSASLRAWIAAFETLEADTEAQRKELRQRADTMVKTMASTTGLERVMPLFLTALGPASWKVRMPILRARWLTAIPCGLAAALTCVMRDDSGFDGRFASNAFFELSKIAALPSEARGALWMKIWADPPSLRRNWESLARLGEPAAIAATPLDPFAGSGPLPMRPALTRALCRVITREDPWLEGPHDSNDPGAPRPAQIVKRALDLLPRVAHATGTTELAIETIDTRWTSLGRAGAVARGRLGCADALPALIAALSEKFETAAEAEGADEFVLEKRMSVETTLSALTAIGRNAASALDAIRALPDTFERALALAAIDPSPQTLEALLPIVERILGNGAEYREQYQEGLITISDYAEGFSPASLVRKLWVEHGFLTPQREVLEKLRALVQNEHEALHGDVTVQPLLAPLT